MCLNLLNNAVKYTKAGGKIRLAVREEDIPVPDRAGEGQPAGRSDGDGRVMLKRKSMGKFLVVWLSLAALLWVGLAQSAFAVRAEKEADVGAESVIHGGDGTYLVPARLGLAMGKENFTDPVTVEKQDGRYYLTMGYNSASIGYLTLLLEGKTVGTVTVRRDGWTYVTYTLSERHLQESLTFAAYIPAMSRETTFAVTLALTAAQKQSDTVSDVGERPAEFVPVLRTDAATEYSQKVGTIFTLPIVSAQLGDENCRVTVTVSFGGEPIDLSNGRLSLDRAGEYVLIYRAESEQYRTSLGHPSFSEYRVVIRSTVGENELVRWTDDSHVLPDGTNVVAGKVSGASAVYERAAGAMEKISDRWEAYTVAFLDAEGEELTPDGTVRLFFRADDGFDRTKAEVYYLPESGGPVRLPTGGYGRYVKAETDRTGVFIVCVPGVDTPVPMWAYALMLLGGITVIAGGAVAVVPGVRRRKRRQKFRGTS